MSSENYDDCRKESFIQTHLVARRCGRKDKKNFAVLFSICLQKYAEENENYARRENENISFLLQYQIMSFQRCSLSVSLCCVVS